MAADQQARMRQGAGFGGGACRHRVASNPIRHGKISDQWSIIAATIAMNKAVCPRLVSWAWRADPGGQSCRAPHPQRPGDQRQAPRLPGG